MADRNATVLGEFIRRQRELSELSMRQVAAMAGISNPYLSQIERGLRAPSDQVLEAIAASLQTTAESLRRDAGVPPPGEDDGEPAGVGAGPAGPPLTPPPRPARARG